MLYRSHGGYPVNRRFSILILSFLLVLLSVLPMSGFSEIVELPIEKNNELVIPPMESGYIYEEGNPDPIGYEDPSISVSIFRGRHNETNYVGAKIKIANATQIRAEMAGRFGSSSSTPAAKLGKHVSSVVAINGDNYASRTNVGWVTRQGKCYRHSCNGVWDVLVIDNEGDLHVLQNAQNADVEAYNDTAVNVFTFGPGMVIDGVPQYGCGNGYMGEKKPAQRMALIQTGKLEYIVLTSEGPEDPGSVGLTLDELIDLIMSFDNVITAYNMDGGSASTLVFKNAKSDYSKINAPNNPKIRPCNDIVYFASAWQPEEPENTEMPVIE